MVTKQEEAEIQDLKEALRKTPRRPDPEMVRRLEELMRKTGYAEELDLSEPPEYKRSTLTHLPRKEPSREPDVSVQDGRRLPPLDPHNQTVADNLLQRTTEVPLRFDDGEKAMSWLGSGSGGDLVPPPNMAGRNSAHPRRIRREGLFPGVKNMRIAPSPFRGKSLLGYRVKAAPEPAPRPQHAPASEQPAPEPEAPPPEAPRQEPPPRLPTQPQVAKVAPSPFRPEPAPPPPEEDAGELPHGESVEPEEGLPPTEAVTPRPPPSRFPFRPPTPQPPPAEEPPQGEAAEPEAPEAGPQRAKRPSRAFVGPKKPKERKTPAAPITERDRELLAGIREGKRYAWDDFYAAHGPRLMRIAHKYLREKELAEDAVQEALMDFYTGRLGQFDESRGSLQSLLNKMVHYKALSMIRGRGRRSELDVSEAGLGAGREEGGRALEQFPEEEVEGLEGLTPEEQEREQALAPREEERLRVGKQKRDEIRQLKEKAIVEERERTRPQAEEYIAYFRNSGQEEKAQAAELYLMKNIKGARAIADALGLDAPKGSPAYQRITATVNQLKKMIERKKKELMSRPGPE